MEKDVGSNRLVARRGRRTMHQMLCVCVDNNVPIIVLTFDGTSCSKDRWGDTTHASLRPPCATTSRICNLRPDKGRIQTMRDGEEHLVVIAQILSLECKYRPRGSYKDTWWRGLRTGQRLMSRRHGMGGLIRLSETSRTRYYYCLTVVKLWLPCCTHANLGGA